MKELITHLIHHHLDDIVGRSLVNCHARGLDSIMLIDTPERRVRLFIADGSSHDLHRNRPSDPSGNPPDTLSIGIHPHHADITLHCIEGQVTNWEADFRKAGSNYNFHGLSGYRYDSAITGEEGKIGFQGVLNGPFSMRVRQRTVLRPGDTLSMKAAALHTVEVPEGIWAAWFVYEGPEDPDYAPLCYSNADLETEDFRHLYQPMHQAMVRTHLERLGLLRPDG